MYAASAGQDISNYHNACCNNVNSPSNNISNDYTGSFSTIAIIRQHAASTYGFVRQSVLSKNILGHVKAEIRYAGCSHKYKIN